MQSGFSREVKREPVARKNKGDSWRPRARKKREMCEREKRRRCVRGASSPVSPAHQSAFERTMAAAGMPSRQSPSQLSQIEDDQLGALSILPTRPSKCSLQITVFQRKISEFWENLWKFYQILLFFKFFWKLSSNFQKNSAFWENPEKNW